MAPFKFNSKWYTCFVPKILLSNVYFKMRLQLHSIKNIGTINLKLNNKFKIKRLN